MITLYIYTKYLFIYRFNGIPHPEKAAKGGEDALYTHEK